MPTCRFIYLQTQEYVLTLDHPLTEVVLEFPDNRLLIDLCGPYDSHLTAVEKALEVQIVRRGNVLSILGDEASQSRASSALHALYLRLESGKEVNPTDVDREMRMGTSEIIPETRAGDQLEMLRGNGIEIKTRKKLVEPRTDAQKSYVQSLFQNEMAFGIGPAGTGKTYLAVAVAVSMLQAGEVDRIILSRPAVEAGERLGFLPGDLREKVDPYLRPLYDALYDMLPGDQVVKRLENGDIEVAPLAFMRGRTLANAFVVLDEAQNATSMQMKMFLTRIGINSRAIVTGDVTQVDLPKQSTSGLIQVAEILKDVEGIGFVQLNDSDVVRHPLVRKIIKAYDKKKY